MLAYCEKCGKKYELEANDRLSDFQCECGGELASNDPLQKQKGLTSHPVIRILAIFVVGVLFFNYVAVYLLMIPFYAIKYVGMGGTPYVLAIFFGICIALIIALLWFAFKRR